MKRLIPFAAALVVLVGGFAWWQSQGSAPGSTAIELPGTANAQTAAADVDISGVSEMTLGDASAPITVIEYASYTCPHCKRFHEGAFKDLRADYIDTGKVHFIYREVYFDRPGLWASMVARCGGSERFFGISDLIYAQQGEWARAGDPSAIAAALRRIGATAGLGQDELDACLSDAALAQSLVAWYQQNAEADNIQSTPSFVIDGVLYQNMSYDRFREILDGKL